MVASGKLVICWTPSLIVLIEYINFHFCTILIRLEIAELAIASYSQLQLVVVSGKLVINQTPSLIVIAQFKNFPIYTVLIRLEIAELATASYAIASHGWELVSQLVDLVLQFLLTQCIYQISASHLVQKGLKYTCLGGWVEWVCGRHNDHNANLSSNQT